MEVVFTVIQTKTLTGNDGGVARVILRDVLLDLADEVSAHVRSLQTHQINKIIYILIRSGRCPIYFMGWIWMKIGGEGGKGNSKKGQTRESKKMSMRSKPSPNSPLPTHWPCILPQ